jgi:ubiquinone/menaquinone biosynthesis C-methylase UbiE
MLTREITRFKQLFRKHLGHTTNFWNLTSRNIPVGQGYDELMAEQYRRVHFNLITAWVELSPRETILKTDLFAEAMCPLRAFLPDILKINRNTTGIDISSEICRRARDMAAKYCRGDLPEIISCDIRQLPFGNASFDLIISDSTLDHFSDKGDIILALRELARVLKPGGTLIITMDNKSNITEPLFRFWILVGLAPFYIGKTYSMSELKQGLKNAGLLIKDCRTIMHNPRYFTKLIVAVIRKIRGENGNHQIRALLDFLDGLEKTKFNLLTAQFIAVKAVKPLQ